MALTTTLEIIKTIIHHFANVQMRNQQVYTFIAYNVCSLFYTDPPLLAIFPPDPNHDVESCGDRLVYKVSQLVSKKPNISEKFMSIWRNISTEYNLDHFSIDICQLH